jgi:hypothetical protein
MHPEAPRPLLVVSRYHTIPLVSYYHFDWPATFHDSLDHSTGSVTAVTALTLGGVSVCIPGSSNASTAFLLDEDDSSLDFFSGS